MIQKAIKCFKGCKDTMNETLQLEDYEEQGILSWSQIRESLESLDITGLDNELYDFLLFILYSKSENLDKLRYPLLIDLVEGKLQPQLGAGSNSETGLGRKRPESSSPEKLKARNKEKFQMVQ